MTIREQPGQLSLWFVFPGSIHDQQLSSRYRALLCDAERAQEARLQLPQAHRYLLTRALTRIILSRYCPFEPADWRFAPDDFGRPRVVHGPADATGLQFSISHTDEAIVLCVAGRNEIGIDIENLDSRPPARDIAARYFAPREAAALAAVAPEQKHARFLAYWTLKESYIKARGKGLALPLDEFGFDLDDSRELDFWSEEACDTKPGNWRFWQFAVAGSYVLAVCVGRSPRDFATVSAFTCVPGESEAELPMLQLRRSR